MANELAITGINSEFQKLIFDLEHCFPSVKLTVLSRIRKRFMSGFDDETVSLSEQLADAVTKLPNRETYTELYYQYESLRNATPDCNNARFISWSCCDTHKMLSYIYMLMRAIAMAYKVDSEGQPLSQLWWKDFKSCN